MVRTQLGAPARRQPAHDACAGLAEACGLGREDLLEHHEIMLVAQHAAQRLDLLAPPADLARPEPGQQLEVVAVIFDALAPVVEALAGGRVVGRPHRLARPLVGALEAARQDVEVIALERPGRHARPHRPEIGAERGDGLLEIVLAQRRMTRREGTAHRCQAPSIDLVGEALVELVVGLEQSFGIAQRGEPARRIAQRGVLPAVDLVAEPAAGEPQQPAQALARLARLVDRRMPVTRGIPELAEGEVELLAGAALQARRDGFPGPQSIGQSRSPRAGSLSSNERTGSEFLTGISARHRRSSERSGRASPCLRGRRCRATVIGSAYHLSHATHSDPWPRAGAKVLLVRGKTG